MTIVSLYFNPPAAQEAGFAQKLAAQLADIVVEHPDKRLLEETSRNLITLDRGNNWWLRDCGLTGQGHEFRIAGRYSSQQTQAEEAAIALRTLPEWSRRLAAPAA